MNRRDDDFLVIDDAQLRSDLYELVDRVKGDNTNDEKDWEVIRKWFSRHPPSEHTEAASYRAKNGTTALHLACRKNATLDVIQLVIDACPEVLEWDDEFGWLPLHYACHHGVSQKVLEELISRSPDTVKVTDTKGRNPLHFAVGNVGIKTKNPFASAVFTSLSQNGASKAADITGKMPLHYACAYGASKNVLEILIAANPKAVTHRDLKGLMPLHYVMGNCDRYDSASIVELLLDKEPSIVNIDFEHKNHPLYILADRANKLKVDDDAFSESRKNGIKAMDLFLNAGPTPTTNFFASLHCLPKWMMDKAVVHPVVQENLNDKISKRFPTAVMMFDFYALVTVLLSFSSLAIGSIDRRSDPDEDDAIPSSKVAPLYICAVYFAVREGIQLLSFIHLDLFRVWYKRGTNWLEIGMIIIVVFWAAVLNTGAMQLDTFRTCAAIGLFFFWLNFLNFLRGLLVDFAVFVSGVLHVVRSLGPFLLALVITLIAFMQMFYTVFQQTSYCEGFDVEKSFIDTCDPESTDPYRFCTGWRTMLTVYTMLLGEVDETDFETSRAATFLFIVFVFLVVILLANVLIALVTDSYGVIRNERAAIVFWSNRLDFIVEMDVISSGVFRNVKMDRDLDRSIDLEKEKGNTENNHDHTTKLWKSVVDVFDKDLNQMEFISLSFLCLTIIRIFIIIVVIPLWVALGLLCFGTLWPHQWRKRLLEQKITERSNSRKERAQRQLNELNEMKNDVENMRREVTEKLAANQVLVDQMRTDIAAVKADMRNELREIQELMDVLYDLHKRTLKG